VRARTYASEWHIPNAYAGYQALLDDPDIDVVYNPLPNHLHAEWTIQAVRAGKHVLCEKPLALSLDEVDAIARAAHEDQRVVSEAFMYRHHPQTIKVKDLVDSGAIGKVQVVNGSFTFKLTDPTDVRMIPEMGGGSVWDVGCYPISYARYIAGAEPIEVSGWQVTGPTGVDETFVGQMRFANGVCAQFDCGFRAPFRTHIEIVGSDGAISIPHPFRPGLGERITVMRGDDVQTLTIPGEELYVGEVEDMADAILLGTPPRVSLADSRGNVATIAALLRSARENRPLPVA